MLNCDLIYTIGDAYIQAAGRQAGVAPVVTKFGVVFLVILLGLGLLGAKRALPLESTVSPQRGVAANQRLTALTGGPLLAMLVVLAVTILLIQPLLVEHYIVGFLLLPPVALKMASTGYRFARYYARDPSYRAAGAPPILLRFGLAPLLVLSTLAAFATGLELWIFGLRFGNSWITAHTVSAVIFVVTAGLHLLGHLRRTADVTLEEVRAPGSREALSRRSLVIGCLLLGAALAVASLLYATPFPPAAAGA